VKGFNIFATSHTVEMDKECLRVAESITKKPY